MSSFIDRARLETFADSIKASVVPEKSEDITEGIKDVYSKSSSKGLMSPSIEDLTADADEIMSQTDADMSSSEDTSYASTMSTYDDLYKKQKTKTKKVSTSNFGEKMMARYISELNLKPFQAAALAGNADYETGGFKFMDELKPTVRGSKGGTNVFQFTGLQPGYRRYNFEKYVEENNLDPKDYDAGVDFSIFELTKGDQKSVLKKLRETETPEEANSVIVNSYLKPDKKKTNMPTREALTLEYTNNYKKDTVQDGL